MKEKRAKAITVIGGADGPTSIFLAGKLPSKKKPLKERVWQCVYARRRKRAKKKICANPHTLQEMIAYAKQKYHAVELPKTARTYAEQYASAKEGLILTRKPELLDDLGEIAWPDDLNEDSVKELHCRMRLRSEKIADIPDHEMPMDFHVYKIRIAGGSMELELDYIWNLFGVSYSGNQKAMKTLKKTARDLYTYYGVSREDMEKETERYQSLLDILSVK